MSEVAGRIPGLLRGRRAVLVGVGNPLRGDDGVGSLLARRLVARGAGRVLDAETVPENFLGTLLEDPADLILLVDAVEQGARPGTCCMGPARILGERCSSTHAPSLLLMARMLEARRKEVWLLGIQPGSTEIAAPLSEPVRAAASALEEALVHALCPGETADV